MKVLRYTLAAIAGATTVATITLALVAAGSTYTVVPQGAFAGLTITLAVSLLALTAVTCLNDVRRHIDQRTEQSAAHLDDRINRLAGAIADLCQSVIENGERAATDAHLQALRNFSKPNGRTAGHLSSVE